MKEASDRATDRTVSDFRSDTVTRPTPAMIRAMGSAPLGDDVFGDDPTVNRLESLAANTLGMEAAIFVPSGTMGNQIAIHVHTQPGDEMLVEQGAHTFLYEAGGAAALSGVQTWPIFSERGIPTVDQIRERLRPDDPHCPRSTLLCLENTHNRYGGRVIPIDPFVEVASFARDHGLKVHLDGARLFHAQVATGVPVSHYARPVDSVMFCLSKGLSAPVGSILAGSGDFIDSARRIRKLFGGGMRQAGVIAAAGIVALEEMVDRLAEDHRRARTLAVELSEFEGIVVDPDRVQTNIVLLSLEPDKLPVGISNASDLAAVLARDHGVEGFVFGDRVFRLVTHKDVGDEDVERAGRAFRNLLRSRTSWAREG